MAPRRGWFLLAVPVIAVALFALSGGTAGAGPAAPAAPAVTPSITDSPTPSPSPTATCPIGGLDFAYFVIDENGQPHTLTHGSAPPITYGDPVAYGAALTYEQGTDVTGQPIEFHRVIVGSSDDRILVLETDSDGVAQTIDIPRYSALYHAEWHGDGDCTGTDFSTGTVSSGVRVSITISATDFTPNAGQTFLVRGGVAPNHPGKYVTVQWKRAGSSTISSSNVTLDSLSHWSKAFRSSTHGARWQFRAIFPKQDDDHQANATGWITVTVN